MVAQRPQGLNSLAQNPKDLKVKTFRIDNLLRTPKVEKLSLQPIRNLTPYRPYSTLIEPFKGTFVIPFKGAHRDL